LSASAVTAWCAVALFGATATIGWVLRRFGKGALTKRLRPHFLLGYGALLCAIAHVSLSMGDVDGANGSGIWFAGLATAGLTLQTLVGTNLQSPGIYRLVLRRWHIALLLIIAVLAIGHIVLNAPFSPGQGVSTPM